MADRVDDIFETVHVVPVYIPVPEVPVGVVLDVPHVLGHDAAGGGAGVVGQAALQHRDLELAQDLKRGGEENISLW